MRKLSTRPSYKTSWRLLLRLMKLVRAVVDHVQDLRRLLIKVRRWGLWFEPSIWTDLQALTRHTTIQAALKGIHNTFHRCQDFLRLDLVVKVAHRYLRAYNIRTYRIESNTFFWKVFSVAAHEADNTAARSLISVAAASDLWFQLLLS